MFTSAVKFVSVAASLASAAPFTFPLQDGFPTPSNDSTNHIAVAAGGTLSNGPPPPKIDPDTLNSFRLIAFNEVFEVAFFNELISNITQRVPGYQLPPGVEQYTVDVLASVQAQEELHALNANGVLKHFNASPIEPCQYDFPVADFESAVTLAQTFTDVVLGTLQDVQSNAAQNSGSDAAGVIAAVSSVIGQEGQQDGFYRSVQGKRPSAQPFLTTGARDFAFTALQSFVVPGSCPNIGDIKLQTFQPLNLITKEVCNGPIEFTATNTAQTTVDAGSQKLVYINGANVPNVVPFTVEKTQGPTVTIKADFPHDEFVMDGLTLAAIVKGSGPFAGADDVAQATLFGPGLIEVN